MTPVPDILAALGTALSEVGLGAALIGGHAVNVWLEPRFTADIDLTVDADPDALRRLRAILERQGWVVATEHGAGLASGPDFVRFARKPHEPVLELQAAKTELQRDVIRRARSRSGESCIPVATVEDLLVLKLIAYRPRDRVDLFGLAALPNLDWSYVEGWAVAWDLTDRLAAVRGGLET